MSPAAVQIRAMTRADIPLGLRLVGQAGWNQLPADWERFLALQPDGCFVAERNGTVVGTTVACVFEEIAWIAMVLVDESHQGSGIGSALVWQALDYCDQQGVRTIRLDATHLGQPVYEKLGFEPQFALTRFAGRISAAVPLTVSSIRTAEPDDYPRLLGFDRVVTRTRRDSFLSRLLAEQPDLAYLHQKGSQLDGWVTVRKGRLAWQLGPCLATPEVGESLLNQLTDALVGEQVFIDIPQENSAAIRWAEAHGLAPARHFVRMCRGEHVSEMTSHLWASSGPELG